MYDLCAWSLPPIMIISRHSAQGGHLTDILVKLLDSLATAAPSISSDTGIIGSKANIWILMRREEC